MEGKEQQRTELVSAAGTEECLLGEAPAARRQQAPASQASFPLTSRQAADADLDRCWSSPPLNGGLGWRAPAPALFSALIPQTGALPGRPAGGGLALAIQSA